MAFEGNTTTARLTELLHVRLMQLGSGFCTCRLNLGPDFTIKITSAGPETPAVLSHWSNQCRVLRLQWAGQSSSGSRSSEPSTGSDFHQDQLSPSWSFSAMLLCSSWRGRWWRKLLPSTARGKQEVVRLSVDLSLLHCASLQLTLPLGNHKRVSGRQQPLLCWSASLPACSTSAP